MCRPVTPIVIPVNLAGQQGQDQVEQPAEPQELEVTIHDLLFAFVRFSQRGSCLIGLLYCEAETAHNSGVDYFLVKRLERLRGGY